MLTNFKTIKSRIARLKDIERMSEDGTFDVLPKKEVIQLKKEWEKLEKNLGGIKEMKKLPDAIFVVDPKKERICVQDAHTLGIPLIGIADTNCDPEELDYVIPGNDDAIRAVKLIVSKMADAVVEASKPAIVKVIIEACLLTDEEKVEACKCSMNAKAEFVKTSTGFSTHGATPEDVALMKKTVGDVCKVKAAGGVRSYDDAMKMIEAGADRLGCSAGIKVMEEAKAR